ncbi:hypothetical protein BUALT_Bualt03G0014500 [Buddleja alternifolia]|uniref:BHLH domain-containing protein n=1 Tax=Buddleja alternifolia TaxID=168488 RepID=A0AAV6XXS0_9LAMI|nr:hypothetical protein BUALT_Bualt03G0014500 [Buddleja alternifolia]
MALSYYSNWGAFQQLDSEMNINLAPPQPEQLPSDLLSFPDVWNIDSLFEPNDLFCTDDSDSLQYDVVNSLTTEPFSLQQDFEPFHYPKRQKPCDYEEIIYSDYNNSFFNEPLFPSPCLNLQDYSMSESVMPPLPDFPTGPPVYSAGNCENVMKKETTPGTLSAQSVAARQRRRKITEKTQELGKLIPGGQKMNTAEMLQAASKYIKYMQAQVGILEFMGSYNQENKEAFESEELHGLLESPLIQEKLYSTEKCLVPQKFVQKLSSDRQIVESNGELLPILKEEH